MSLPAVPSSRFALRGDLLDFTSAPLWGEVDSPAVRFRPDHWLLIDAGRSADTATARID